MNLIAKINDFEELVYKEKEQYIFSFISSFYLDSTNRQGKSKEK